MDRESLTGFAYRLAILKRPAAYGYEGAFQPVALETISPKDFGREWLERESATVFDGSNPPQAKSTRTRRRRETSPDTNANSTTDPGVFHGVKRRPFLLGPKGLTIPTASRPLDEKSLIRVLRQNPTTKQQPVAPWNVSTQTDEIMPLGNMLDLFTSSPQIDASYIDPGFTTPLPPDHLHGLYSLLSTDHLSGNPSLRPFLPIPDWLEEISLDRLHGGDSKKEQRWDIQIVMAGTVTDFHIDYSGTSVLFHLVSGRKIFYFTDCSQSDVAIFQDWENSLTSEEGASNFLGDRLKVYQVTLEPGQTAILPAGIPHAVYTPLRSIALSLNFLHAYNYDEQIALHLAAMETVDNGFSLPSSDFDDLIQNDASLWIERLSDAPARQTFSTTLLRSLEALSHHLVASCTAESIRKKRRPEEALHRLGTAHGLKILVEDKMKRIKRSPDSSKRSRRGKGVTSEAASVTDISWKGDTPSDSAGLGSAAVQGAGSGSPAHIEFAPISAAERTLLPGSTSATGPIQAIAEISDLDQEPDWINDASLSVIPPSDLASLRPAPQYAMNRRARMSTRQFVSRSSRQLSQIYCAIPSEEQRVTS